MERKIVFEMPALADERYRGIVQYFRGICVFSLIVVFFRYFCFCDIYLAQGCRGATPNGSSGSRYALPERQD